MLFSKKKSGPGKKKIIEKLVAGIRSRRTQKYFWLNGYMRPLLPLEYVIKNLYVNSYLATVFHLFIHMKCILIEENSTRLPHLNVQ